MTKNLCLKPRLIERILPLIFIKSDRSGLIFFAKDVLKGFTLHDIVANWVTQLRDEGFLEDDGAAVAAAPSPATGAPVVEAVENLAAHSNLLDQEIATQSTGGLTLHYNPKTKVTMWTSANGRECFYCADKSVTPAAP